VPERTRHDVVIFGDDFCYRRIEEVSMDYRLAQYVEITSRIRSSRRYCEFLASGGTVWDQPAGLDWQNVTAEVFARERKKVEQLENVRLRLYPDLAEEEISPPLYSH
jgi:hypothetical protein